MKSLKTPAAVGDAQSLAHLFASQTNDEMQVILLSRRRSGLPGGLGDSRAIHAAIYENLTELLMGCLPSCPRP